jgi:hypothetical protein
VRARLPSGRSPKDRRLVELDDDSLAIQFWQSDFPGYRWPLDRALRSFLAQIKRITWDGLEADFDHLYDTVAAACPQDDDQLFYTSLASLG